MAEFFGQKWGDSNIFGTSGNVVTWSVAGGGIDISGMRYVRSDTSTALNTFLDFDFVKILQRAFDAWSAVANIEFVRVRDGGDAHDTDLVADIRIFGGVMTSRNIVGAASGPTFAPFVAPESGNIAFSSTENWSASSFLAVALHEIGHSIGLDHENDVAAVMNSVADKTSLLADDIFGAQIIYGPQDFAPWVYNMLTGQKDLKILVKIENLTVNGTDGKEIIKGGSGGETFKGKGGNDTLRGNGGSDTLLGGGGNDVLLGGNGNDNLRGGGGDDRMLGAGGVDALSGGKGRDILKGGGRGDRLAGNDDNDKLLGQGGADDLSGGSGKDLLIGGAGGDRLEGGTGNDKLKGRGGDDIFEYVVGGDVDRIRDFEDGSDRIDLSDFGFPGAFQALSFASQVGDDVVFLFGGGDKLFVDDTLVNALGSADLIL